MKDAAEINTPLICLLSLLFVCSGLASQDGLKGNKPPFYPPGIGRGNPREILRAKSDKGPVPREESL